MDEVLQRSEKFARFTSHVDELQRLQIVLSLHTADSAEQASLPCYHFPAARNSRFYDIENIIQKVDSHCNRETGEKELRSLALLDLEG